MNTWMTLVGNAWLLWFHCLLRAIAHSASFHLFSLVFNVRLGPILSDFVRQYFLPEKSGRASLWNQILLIPIKKTHPDSKQNRLFCLRSYCGSEDNNIHPYWENAYLMVVCPFNSKYQLLQDSPKWRRGGYDQKIWKQLLLKMLMSKKVPLPKLLPVKTKKQIAEEYQISSRTLRRWIVNEKLNLPRRYLTPKDQLKIYELFGNPPELTQWGLKTLNAIRACLNLFRGKAYALKIPIRQRPELCT